MPHSLKALLPPQIKSKKRKRRSSKTDESDRFINCVKTYCQMYGSATQPLHVQWLSGRAKHPAKVCTRVETRLYRLVPGTPLPHRVQSPCSYEAAASLVSSRLYVRGSNCRCAKVAIANVSLVPGIQLMVQTFAECLALPLGHYILIARIYGDGEHFRDGEDFLRWRVFWRCPSETPCCLIVYVDRRSTDYFVYVDRRSTE